MAGALVGGAFLSAFLQVAFDRVASREVLDFLKGRKDIWGLLRKLKIKLLSANAVLNDAEEKQITDPAVKEWLDELQDAVYDADELLDGIAYEGLRYKIEADSQTTGTSLVQNPIPSSVSSSEFEKILENLEFIIEQMGVLGLKEVSGGVPVPSPRISTSCQEKCGVFGREMDKEAIFRLLQSNEASSDEICVVPIVAKGLRTFLVEAFSSTWFNDYIEKKMDDLLETFKCLRVLSWSKRVCIRELPVSIGNLQHLRYLNIYGTNITHLPDSLCRLYNLQTLILSSQITNLPTNMGKLINLRHLDNSQSHMKEMPPQMGKLKKLRKLPVFVVGKHGGSSIRELGELHHLSGKLSILNLENVHCTIDDPEIPKVMLKDKQDLTELVLEWDFLRYIEDSIKEKSLLDQLCPHTNLNSLTIKYYGGTSFPNWLGDSSFLNMVSLKLYRCMYCFALPPLGQLPTLKKLEIYGLVRVVAVGREFYGNGYSTIKPFRSLEYLSFAYMLEWKEWVTFEDEVFSRLQELHIGGAPKLSVLPNCLPSLTKLEIRRCEQLVSLPRAPVLREIELLWNWKIQFASGHYYPSLECMTMRGVCDSMSLEFFPKLKYIIIYDCENFEYLTSLEIKNCPNFISFPSGGLHAPILTKMKVESCNKLQSLPEGMHTLLPSLVTLELLDCPELESFPEGGLPSNLVKLEISSCNKLISCRMEWGLQSLHSLKEFSIAHKYEEVDSFPEEVLLPPSLAYFSILDFSNMKSLNGKGFQHLTSLKTLSIERCHKLECLPEEGLPTSLSQLHILGCPLLKQRCEKEKGEDWLKIAHIPNIVMSYESLNTSAQLQGLLDCQWIKLRHWCS
nr:putative disease resistance rpp13-like protein 1 [Quercus suber]